MSRTIKKAAETIITMSADYLAGGLAEKTFVANVARYARLMDAEINPIDSKQEREEREMK